MYFSSVLSSPFSPSLKKKNATSNCVDFQKQLFSSSVKMVPSPSLTEDNFFVLKKTRVGSGVFFLCVVIIGYVEYK